MNTFLYPEKTRTDLELDYQMMTAALWAAAEQVVGSDPEAKLAQVNAWLSISAEMAVRGAVVRQARNLAKFEGVLQ